MPAPKIVELYGISTHLYIVYLYERTHQGHHTLAYASFYQVILVNDTSHNIVEWLE